MGLHSPLRQRYPARGDLVSNKGVFIGQKWELPDRSYPKRIQRSFVRVRSTGRREGSDCLFPMFQPETRLRLRDPILSKFCSKLLFLDFVHIIDNDIIFISEKFIAGPFSHRRNKQMLVV